MPRRSRAKARENLEERGLRTLSLGVGMATWTNHRGTAAPNAPILLRSVSLTPRGGAEEDFDFAATDEWEFNPTLAHMLRTDFSIEVDGDDVVDAGVDEGGRLDPAVVFDQLETIAAGVTGFAVTARAILANLSYAKMPMVQDLEGSLDALVEHPLICALAGSTADRDAIRDGQAVAGAGIDETTPDRTAPSDEFLVLDADASQSQVINLAVAGTNLVVQGPPGTGKSQTISNLIASLVARGRSVLFVAEKRAAIDAVTKRLNHVGLGDVVLDLHDGASSRKRLAADLGRVLQAMGQVPAPDFSDVQRTLVTRRSALNDHASAMHERRSPWDVTVYDLQSSLFAIPATSHTELRLFGASLLAFDAAAYPSARDELTEWLNLGGAAVAAGTTPWAGAAARVRTSEDALRLQQHVADLRTAVLPTARARGARGARGRRRRAPHARRSLRRHDLAQRCRRDPAGALARGLWSRSRPAHRGSGTRGAGGLSAAFATLFRSRYRAARRAARDLRIADEGSTRRLREELVRAEDQRRRWSGATVDGGRPRAVDGIDAAAAALEELRSSLLELGGWVGWVGARAPTGRGFDEVANDLEDLANDSATLSRLPRLAELAAGLEARGLGPFVGEIAGRGLGPPAALESLAWLRARSILDHVSATDARIGAFDGAQQRASVEQFIVADEAQIQSGVVRTRRAMAEAALEARNAHPDQSAVLDKNAHMKRRHTTIRDLMQQAPDVLLAVRPCWVMSPLVVAQLLPGGRPFFDVVVFDEASQIRPADAIPALARARQAVVAGDSKQLPPDARSST